MWEQADVDLSGEPVFGIENDQAFHVYSDLNVHNKGQINLYATADQGGLFINDASGEEVGFVGQTDFNSKNLEIYNHDASGGQIILNIKTSTANVATFARWLI